MTKERERERPKENPSSLSLSSPSPPSPSPSPSSPPVTYTFSRLDGVDWPWWANTWFFVGSILWLLVPILLWMRNDHEANVATLLAATCFVIDGFFYFGDWYYAKKERLRRTGNTCPLYNGGVPSTARGYSAFYLKWQYVDWYLLSNIFFFVATMGDVMVGFAALYLTDSVAIAFGSNWMSSHCWAASGLCTVCSWYYKMQARAYHKAPLQYTLNPWKQTPPPSLSPRVSIPGKRERESERDGRNRTETEVAPSFSLPSSSSSSSLVLSFPNDHSAYHNDRSPSTPSVTVVTNVSSKEYVAANFPIRNSKVRSLPTIPPLSPPLSPLISLEMGSPLASSMSSLPSVPPALNLDESPPPPSRLRHTHTPGSASSPDLSSAPSLSASLPPSSTPFPTNQSNAQPTALSSHSVPSGDSLTPTPSSSTTSSSMSPSSSSAPSSSPSPSSTQSAFVPSSSLGKPPPLQGEVIVNMPSPSLPPANSPLPLRIQSSHTAETSKTSEKEQIEEDDDDDDDEEEEEEEEENEGDKSTINGWELDVEVYIPELNEGTDAQQCSGEGEREVTGLPTIFSSSSDTQSFKEKTPHEIRKRKRTRKRDRSKAKLSSSSSSSLPRYGYDVEEKGIVYSYDWRGLGDLFFLPAGISYAVATYFCFFLSEICFNCCLVFQLLGAIGYLLDAILYYPGLSQED